MKVGIDINPMLEKIVGKGLFLKNTIRVLQVIDKKNEYFLFGKEDPHIELPPNFHFVKIKGNLGSKWDFKCVALQKLRYRTQVFLTVKSFYSAIFHPHSVFGLHDVGPLQLPEAYPPATINKFRRLVPLS